MSRRAAIALAVFVIALIVYFFTLAPTVALIDSGELTDAAWSLGNAHPPGFPLFVLVTHLFTLIPMHSVAWRANLASAFFSAAAAAFAALAAFEVLEFPTVRSRPAEAGPHTAKRRKRPQDSAPPPPALPPAASAAIALACGLLLAISKTVWRYATVTEVYALNTALMAAIAWLMLWWARTRRTAPLYAAAFLFGLALGVHHVTIGLGAVAIAVLITRTAGAAFWRSKQCIIAAALLWAGLLIYLYIPIAAAHDPAMNWGNPRTAHQVWDHLTGKAYRAYLTSEGTSLSAQIDRYFQYLVRELGPPWLPVTLLIAVVGMVMLWFRQRTLLWYLILMLVADVAWVLFYPVKHDQDAYAIPSFLALILAFAIGAKRLCEWKPAAAPAILLVPILAGAVAYPVRDRSRYWVAHDFVTNAFRAMSARPLLITADWQMYSPMRYLLDVERARPDVAVVETGFLQSDWYHEELTRRYPESMRGCEKEQQAVRNALRRFDLNPALWKDDAARGELNDRLDDLILAIIARQLPRGPVYLTMETALAWDQRDKKLIDRLKSDRDIVPRGIVMEVMAGHSIREVRPVPIVTRGLIDGTVRYDDDEVVPNELIPTYAAAFLTRGRYLAVTRHLKEALADYQQAAAFDPENHMLEQELTAIQAAAH